MATSKKKKSKKDKKDAPEVPEAAVAVAPAAAMEDEGDAAAPAAGSVEPHVSPIASPLAVRNLGAQRCAQE